MANSKLALTPLLLLLAGCSVPSLHPFYTERDLVFEPALMGEWRQPDDDKSRITFKQAGANAYEIAHRDEDKTYRYTGRMIRIAGQTFLDLYPLEDPDRSDDAGYVATHNIYRVAVEGDTLRFGGIRATWLSDALTQKKIEITHQRFRPPGDSQDRVLLTASTPELQELLRRIGANNDAFFDSKLTRKK